MKLIYNPNSKDSRDFIEGYTLSEVVAWSDKIAQQHPAISRFPVVVYDNGKVYYPETHTSILENHPPNLVRFLDLATGSPEWLHISKYDPMTAGLLFTALTARSDITESTLTANIQGFMAAINVNLAALNKSLSDQLVDSVDENGDPIQITMSQQVDEWLSACHFGFTMADIGG